MGCGMSGKRQIENDREIGKKEWVVMKRPKVEGFLSLSLSLSFVSLSIVFFLSEIDQRPRETD